MKKKHLIFKSINLFLSISLALLFTKCGSFQGSSYFDSDGIYFSESKSSLEKTNAITKYNYYEQYFKNAANNGYVDISEEEIYFTDTNSYTSSDSNPVDMGIENNSQIPWGGETSQTEIILNNFPNYSWGFTGFGLGFSPFWNNYFGNPHRFGYGGFYSPFMNYPYWNPYRGYAGMWGGFNSFYSPFGFRGGFYNPYGFGYRNGWANRWNRFGDYYGDNLRQRNKRDYRSTVARIKSGRGEKNYDSPREKIRENTQSNDSKVRDIQNTLNRVNIGRGSNSIGRNLVVGYDRNRLNDNTRSIGNSKRNNRPGINTNSLTRDARQPLSNNTISNSSTRSPIGLSRVSRSNQTQYRLIERNPYSSSTRVQQNSNSDRLRSQPKSSNPRSSYRIVRNSNRNKNRSSVNYSNNRTQRSNNYSRSNNSYTNYRSSTPSYNSGGGRSAGRGSSSGSRGRTN